MSLDERISELIKRIYCAGQDPNEWDRVSDDVLMTIGAKSGLTTLVDLHNREYSTTKYHGRDPMRLANALEEYAQIYSTDPTLIWASKFPSARFCDSAVTLPASEYLTNPFVQWMRDRLGATHWLVGYTPPEQRLSYSFSVHFPAEQGPGKPEAKRLFRMLFDHLECAMRLNHTPFDAESDWPLLLLDGDGNVREASNGAMKALATPDGLTIGDTRLRAALVPEQAALDRALSCVRNVAIGGTSSQAVKISRPSGKRPWILTIRPRFSGYGPFGTVKSEMIVQIHDGAPRIGSLELLQTLFDLTSRELEVVRLLAEGHSIESLACHMKISTNTARTHLRSIFAKTGSSRQSELLQLCSSLASV